MSWVTSCISSEKPTFHMQMTFLCAQAISNIFQCLSCKYRKIVHLLRFLFPDCLSVPWGKKLNVLSLYSQCLQCLDQSIEKWDLESTFSPTISRTRNLNLSWIVVMGTAKGEMLPVIIVRGCHFLRPVHLLLEHPFWSWAQVDGPKAAVAP